MHLLSRQRESTGSLFSKRKQVPVIIVVLAAVVVSSKNVDTVGE